FSRNDVRPRVMIARIHHFQLKEKILQLARQQFPLRYNGKAVHFFPDYPAEVMKQRQAFDPVRKRLRDAGVRSVDIWRLGHPTDRDYSFFSQMHK
uniref:Uncharacterized protein n=1 Tax=Cyprinus carpio carpio TaxID=630221 RepID=A0A9J8DLZ5_CYPCA